MVSYPFILLSMVCLTSFEENVVLKWAMTTSLSRQHEMTGAIGAKNDESRSRSRSQI